jgi:hypothetical protein
MRTSRHRRSRAYLDRVIEGEATDVDPLVGLVHQIQAQPRRRETHGLRAASSAFAWAPSARPYLPPHHRTGLSSTAARMWHPKLLVVGLTFIVAATIAVASTGNLPTKDSPATVSASEIDAALSSRASVLSQAARPQPAPRRTTPAKQIAVPPPASGSGLPTVTTSPTTESEWQVWWCNVWLAVPGGSRVIKYPLFVALLDQKGGVEGLDKYCGTLLNSPVSSTHLSGGPTATDQPFRGQSSSNELDESAVPKPSATTPTD